MRQIQEMTVEARRAALVTAFQDLNNWRYPKGGRALKMTRPSRTLQHQAGDVNVNQLVARFNKTGVEPVQNPRQFFYGQFTEDIDFRAVQDSVIKVNELFSQLPWQVRKFFNHSPSDLIEFLGNPANRDQAILLGLVDKEAKTSKPAAQTPSKPPEEGIEGDEAPPPPPKKASKKPATPE